MIASTRTGHRIHSGGSVAVLMAATIMDHPVRGKARSPTVTERSFRVAPEHPRERFCPAA
ncbi:hypothetical protein Asp14428_22000 [Actinoplanes sp. NBRC 14428]|nr:hypothetical protein Asp14428_22000 [Actinoplanes sp. NBRC 14428]